ncbi:MAG: hypothetical protein NTV49_00510, partial [Kiritimatiellaeota bacterium]|nr:hypothetical protein [Kiritimatiellota bacterium]
MYRSRIVLGSLAILASVAAFPGAARADIIKPPAGTTMTIGVGETYTLPQNDGTFAVGEWDNSGSTLNQTGGLIQDEATSGVWGTYGVGRSNGTGHYNMSGGVLSLPGLNGASAAYSFSVGGGWGSSCYGEFNLSGTAVANIGSLTVGVGTGSGVV